MFNPTVSTNEKAYIMGPSEKQISQLGTQHVKKIIIITTQTTTTNKKNNNWNKTST